MSALAQRDLQHACDVVGDAWASLRGESVFITGGTGFVGRWLVESVLHANDALDLRCRIFVLTRDASRLQASAPHIGRHASVEVIEGNARALRPMGMRIQHVVHAATEAVLRPGLEHPTGVFGADTESTRHLLEFARAHGTQRFLFTSSGAVYGTQPPALTHVSEDYLGAPPATDVRFAYGHAKRASEFLVSAYAQAYGFEPVIARLFAFVGPLLPLDLNFAVGNFLRDAMAGDPVNISGDGTALRSYLYAADMASWLWTLLLRGEAGRPYNVGASQAISIAELARLVVQRVDPSVSIHIAGTAMPGQMPARYVPSVARASDELGLRPLVSLADGITRMHEWHRLRASG